MSRDSFDIMSGDSFDQDAWLARIGYAGPRTPTLTVLRDLVYAHATAIAYESIDVLLERPTARARSGVAATKDDFAAARRLLF